MCQADSATDDVLAAWGWAGGVGEVDVGMQPWSKVDVQVWYRCMDPGAQRTRILLGERRPSGPHLNLENSSCTSLIQATRLSWSRSISMRVWEKVRQKQPLAESRCTGGWHREARPCLGRMADGLHG